VTYKLTSEQRAIIHHPLGNHARVLAVAGSGKTTTMVHRVRHLVMDLNQDVRRIRVVMFNRLAREDFERKLAEEIFEVGKRPKVLTFHALAFRMRLDAQKQGLIPRNIELWTGDKEELVLICMHRVIDSLLKEGIIEDDVDPYDALDAIGLWKASLIPPERAGHRTNPDLPLVYRRFKEFREKKRALTFDDFVPKALELVEASAVFRRRWTNRLDYLIVDEYQDINYGQQQLVRLLAGSRADVMVVGDDDQTIYEWRAARPHYILQGFKKDFSNKPVLDYKLSHSFRFGPLAAQAAYNTISSCCCAGDCIAGSPSWVMARVGFASSSPNAWQPSLTRNWCWTGTTGSRNAMN
jgi:DNA helicase-2/ATP-dependent DNA helicase PcrA